MYLCQKFTNVLIFANMLEKEITLQDLVSDKDGVIKVISFSNIFAKIKTFVNFWQRYI